MDEDDQNASLTAWLTSIHESIKDEMREMIKVKDIDRNPVEEWFTKKLYRHKVKMKFRQGSMFNIDAYVHERLSWIKDNLTKWADCITYWNWNDEYVIEFRFMQKRHATMFALRWAE